MPTYEYQCEACGNRFEKFQSIKAAPIKKCPRCGKNKVRRLISSGAGLIFKGSGFYITDYRDKSYTDKAKADTADKKLDSKSDAKPASTSDSQSTVKEGAAPSGKPEVKPVQSKKPDAPPPKKEPKKKS